MLFECEDVCKLKLQHIFLVISEKMKSRQISRNSQTYSAKIKKYDLSKLGIVHVIIHTIFETPRESRN